MGRKINQPEEMSIQMALHKVALAHGFEGWNEEMYEQSSDFLEKYIAEAMILYGRTQFEIGVAQARILCIKESAHAFNAPRPEFKP